MKKKGIIIKGLVIAGILSFCLNLSLSTQQASNVGDGGAPARPDLMLNISDTSSSSDMDGNGGGIVAKES
ncbi:MULTISPECIES: Phr family secreted Rap phosphatase inhibitor [unclassified Bacillus cereus group]|uniref:Phr family secreted Rap phosphatase inhibitor n=1 Tax=unclassified Bacillus cereus group TaxID=2750818 RepID=UPI001F589634|nr:MULTISPECIES: Phr family secreted Rap phosphatase inhibitor [unclassified Bacillus cereus group]